MDVRDRLLPRVGRLPATRVSTLVLIALATATALSGCAHSGGARGSLGARSGDGSYPQVGVASFYSRVHQGRTTASGTTFDNGSFTAAHRTLPFGTRLRVTHLANRKSVVVTVVDRGPFVRGRIVDLSRRAARQLGFLSAGLARVRIERVR